MTWAHHKSEGLKFYNIVDINKSHLYLSVEIISFFCDIMVCGFKGRQLSVNVHTIFLKVVSLPITQSLKINFYYIPERVSSRKTSRHAVRG